MTHYAGALLTDGGSGAGWTQVADTCQCVHCQTHWVVRPGSGIVRGWCFKCMGPICGAACVVCVPWEKALEAIEAGR